jgi:hypothetical protein
MGQTAAAAAAAEYLIRSSDAASAICYACFVAEHDNPYVQEETYVQYKLLSSYSASPYAEYGHQPPLPAALLKR